MPVISNLVYTVTDSTIVATWTTDTSSDSNLSAGGKAAIDNGVAANSTSHTCIVVGLSPATQYSCVVTSGGSSSSPQNVTTAASATRTAISSIQFNGVTTSVSTAGDSVTDFISNDNISYNIMNDGHGWPSGNVGAPMQVDNLSSEVAPLAGSTVNLLTGYGTAIPGASKVFGIIGLNGNLFITPAQQSSGGAGSGDTFGNFIGSQDHGATWNSFQAPNTYTSTGTLPSPLTTLFFDNGNIGCVMPIRYGVDDGTLGYNTAGNQIDGANGFVYASYHTTGYLNNNSFFMLRIPRIRLLSLTSSSVQYWHGPASPAPSDFVNDSNWTSSSTGATACYTNTGKVSWGHITFIPGLNRYFTINWYYPSGSILATQSVWFPMEAPTPAGPWTVITSRTNEVSGWFSPSVMHRKAAANTATTNVALDIVYSGTNNASRASFYLPTISSLILNPTPVTYATPAVVNFTTGGTSGSVSSISTSTFNSTSGNLLVVGIRGGTGSLATITSVKNNAGVSLTRITAADALQSTSQATIMYYLPNTTGSASDKITVQFSAPQTFTALCCWEISGCTASPLDVANSFVSTAVTSITSNPVANSQSVSIFCFIGGMATTNNTYSFPGIPVTCVVDSAAFPSGAGNLFVGAGHLITNSQLSTGITVTETGASAVASISVAVFNAASSSSGGSGTQGDMLQVNRWCSRMWP